MIARRLPLNGCPARTCSIVTYSHSVPASRTGPARYRGYGERNGGTPKFDGSSTNPSRMTTFTARMLGGRYGKTLTPGPFRDWGPTMKIGIVLGTNAPEVAWNALRFGVTARDEGHAVRMFLVNSGVEVERIRDPKFDVPKQLERFVKRGGQVLACGTSFDTLDIYRSSLF